MKNNNHISKVYELEERSEQVREVLGTTPRWLVSWGSTLIFLIILVFICLAYFIKYPDIIVSRVIISNDYPPVKLVAHANGNIGKIFIKEGQDVKKGQPLCWIDNAATIEDVYVLKQIITALKASHSIDSSIMQLTLSGQLQVGELQPAFSDLYQGMENLRFFLGKNYMANKLQELKTQISNNHYLKKSLAMKENMLKEQLTLEQELYQANQKLAKEKVIAPLELNQSGKKLLEQRLLKENNQSALIQTDIQIQEYKKNINEISDQLATEKNNLLSTIKETIKKLDGLIAEWENKYVLKSPYDGKAHFNKNWAEGQYISAGELLVVVSSALENLVARGTAGINGFGKVQKGQRVIIKFYAYPYEEYGYVEGRIDYASDLAIDSGYSIRISLRDQLITSRNKIIPSGNELLGYAEILTNEKTILQRLFERIIGKTS